MVDTTKRCLFKRSVIKIDFRKNIGHVLPVTGRTPHNSYGKWLIVRFFFKFRYAVDIDLLIRSLDSLDSTGC